MSRATGGDGWTAVHPYDVIRNVRCECGLVFQGEFSSMLVGETRVTLGPKIPEHCTGRDWLTGWEKSHTCKGVNQFGDNRNVKLSQLLNEDDGTVL